MGEWGGRGYHTMPWRVAFGFENGSFVLTIVIFLFGADTLLMVMASLFHV